MKTKQLLLIVLIFSITAFKVRAQEEELKGIKELYDKELKEVQKIRSESILPDKSLNLLFADKIGTAFGGSNDLSLQKYNATLNTEDDSFSLNVNFDTRGKDKKIQKLAVILSGGIKVKSEDGFANFTSEKKGFLNENIELSFKGTYIFNGNLNYEGYNNKKTNEIRNRKKLIEEYRKILFEKYLKKEDDFNSKDLEYEVDYRKYITTNDDYKLESIADLIKDKKEELYIELLESEIKNIEKEKLYKFYSTKWVSTEFTIPLGENLYKTTTDYAIALDEKKFYAFKANASFNYMRVYSANVSFFFKALATLKNNNTILVNDVSSITFENQTVAANNFVVVDSSEKGYKTSYEEFATTSLFIEPSFFFLNNTVGFSPAIEFNAGKYNKTNWKLGIPVSLKDKEGKPKVNFELQWKEVGTLSSTTHFLGVSTSFLFGDLIN